MVTATAHLIGGPCDGQQVNLANLDRNGKLPDTVWLPRIVGGSIVTACYRRDPADTDDAEPTYWHDRNVARSNPRATLEPMPDRAAIKAGHPRIVAIASLVIVLLLGAAVASCILLAIVEVWRLIL